MDGIGLPDRVGSEPGDELSAKPGASLPGAELIETPGAVMACGCPRARSSSESRLAASSGSRSFPIAGTEADEAMESDGRSSVRPLDRKEGGNGVRPCPAGGDDEGLAGNVGGISADDFGGEIANLLGANL